MRVILIFLLLIIVGFFGWKGLERLRGGDRPPEAITTESVKEGEAAPTSRLPSFDIVRIDASGDAVIAGRAAPDAVVTVFINDEVLSRTTAQPDGSWVIVTETPLGAGAIELSLEMTTTDGTVVRSEETIIIVVPTRAGDRPLVLRTTPGGASQVLQDQRVVDAALGPLALEAIDYDDSGSVILSGRSEPGRVVQLFADRRPIGQTTSDAAGRWTMTATMAPGRYTLLVVQLDADGRPAFAIELPFERARPDEVVMRDGRVIVQPGNSLWRIARLVYGRGSQYTVIYEANADQIRDPDLIYPGQIFALPEGTAPSQPTSEEAEPADQPE